MIEQKALQVFRWSTAAHRWLLLYVFMVLTGVGSSYSLLQSAKIEQGIFVIAMLLSAIHLGQHRPSLTDAWLWLMLVMTCLLLAPLLSSLANDHYLSIMATSRYRQLIKIFLCFAALVPLVQAMPKDRAIREIYLTVVLGTLTLSITVLFRFYWLGEAHPETGRMNLHIRHGNANYVAAYLGSLLVLSLLALRHFSETRLRTWRWFAAVAVLTSLVGIFASSSRMGILAVVSAVSLWAIAESRRRHSARPLVFLGFALGLSLAIGLYLDAFTRFEKMVDPSSLGRVQGIKAGLILFSNSPVFGAGFDQTPAHIYRLTRYPLFREFAAPPVSLHNAWFQMLSEMGLFGFTALAALWSWVGWQVGHLPSSMLRVALICVLLVVFLNQQTLPVAYNDVFYCLPLLVGAIAISGRKDILW
jgi:hypothetical protein